MIENVSQKWPEKWRKQPIIDSAPVLPYDGRNTAKIYGVNTVDGRNIYGRQFASLKARRYGCFTRTTVPYKPYCTVTVRSPNI